MRHLLITLLIISGITIPTYFVAHRYFEDNPLEFGAKKGNPIPVSKGERTQKDYHLEKYRWLRRLTVEAYQSKKTAASEIPAMTAFLDSTCKAVAYKAEQDVFASLEKEGGALLASGNSDPLLALWIGRVLFENGKFDAAVPYLNKSHGWEETSYPLIHAFLAYRTKAQIYMKRKDSYPETAKKSIKKALKYFRKSIVAREFSDTESPIAYRLLLETDADDYGLGLFQRVLKKIEIKEDVDPWLYDMLKGNSHIDQAWEARGAGWAKDVTDEQWKGFKRHLDIARPILTGLWKQDRHRPEAAAMMIRVTMAGYGNRGDTVRLWFDRAVKAQMDYPYAYYGYAKAILPRWGGSHQEMITFGRECMATGRYDTDVPLFYLYLLREVAAEQDGNLWRAIFRRQDSQRELEQLFELLSAEPQRNGQITRIQTQRALVSAWCGRYAKAKSILDNINIRADIEKGFWGDPLSWSRRNWETIEAELEAFTGPLKNDLMRAQALTAQDDRLEDAITLFEQSMEAIGHQSVRGYLRNRIALLRMGYPEEKVIYPVLNMAAKFNELEVVRFLVENGADINAKSKSHWTALSTALKNKRPQVADYLIDHGANPNVSGYGRRTPLHYAFKYKQPEIAMQLIESGADVNAQSYWGWSGLLYALYYNYPEHAQILLQRGAEARVATIKNYSPLHYCAIRGYPELISLLVSRGCDVNAMTKNDLGPLHHALVNGHSEAALTLIRHGANINSAAADNWRPLHYALANGLPQIAKVLIDAGADVNAATKTKWTPLHLCAYHGYPEVVRMLLDKGAQIDAEEENGITPLMIAKERRMASIEGLLGNQ